MVWSWSGDDRKDCVFVVACSFALKRAVGIKVCQRTRRMAGIKKDERGGAALPGELRLPFFICCAKIKSIEKRGVILYDS